MALYRWSDDRWILRDRPNVPAHYQQRGRSTNTMKETIRDIILSIFATLLWTWIIMSLILHAGIE